MEIHRPFFFFHRHFILTLFLLTTTLFQVHGRLLPIVNVHGGNTTKYEAYIVHVQKPMGSKFQTFRDRKDWYMSFLPNTTLDSGEPRMIYTYRHAISGFAAMLTQEELEAMKSTDGFLLGHKDRELQARTTYTPKFLGLDRWGGMMYDSAYGNGQIIGVIDTGITYDHPSFGAQGMPPPPPRWKGQCYWKKNGCSNKLIGAIGFKNGRVVSPIDDDGHGTHCASIAAGNFVHADVLGNAEGTASGTAPGAHLAVYTGSQNTDTLKGLDEAIRDHVDVLSMSLGFSPPRSFDADDIAVASFAAVTENIVPVQAGGNDGPLLHYVDGAPWILTVGSSTTDRRLTAVVKLGDGREFDGESAYQPNDFPPTQLPLVYPYDILNTEDSKLCQGNSVSSLDVKGKIVLCGSSGDYKVNIKSGELVKKAGGAAVIIMTQPGYGNKTDDDAHVLPASSVPFYAAWEIISYYKTAATPTAAIIFKGTQFGAKPAPMVSSFSSRGPNSLNGNIIKPDVIAPGSNILGAWPKEVGPNPTTGTKSTFIMVSGTSMAAPHVSGIVALLRHNHPDWSAAAIKSAIMTTASTKDNEGNPITDQYDGSNAGAFTMGSGQVNPIGADKPGLVYDIEPHDYIRYLCGLKTLSDKQVSAIVRGPITCSQVNTIDAEQLNYPSISVRLGPKSKMKTVVNRAVTSVADGASVYTVKINNPEGVNVEVDPRTLQFSQLGEKHDFTVTLSIQGVAPKAGKISEGQISWDSGKYLARSPIAVTFT